MTLTENDLVLVTGATGLVGSHVAEALRRRGVAVRALVRRSADVALLEEWGVEPAWGDLTDPIALQAAVKDVTVIVHCAAKVGDWGPVEDYRAVNVRGLEKLLTFAEQTEALKRFVQISSLGVYEARDHHGTDESTPPNASGIDGYTLTKFESEQLVLEHVESRDLPAVVLRPGFIYGPRDRTVLPRIMEKIKSGQFAFLGSGDQLLNNTNVKNLVAAVMLAIESDDVVGEVFNITDQRLVSKTEFISTICKEAGYEMPQKHVPLGVAKLLAKGMEGAWRLLGKKEAPLLSLAKYKFLGLNLDFSIEKAKSQLGYAPAVEFEQGMRETIAWFRDQRTAEPQSETVAA
ncbi:NAD-dependent epimerase/dehydratase family protein [Stratiformator vulcanicus]|uniref:3 beta-hydroxysteroid dehydrogenase/Delta 5-->4-isomerase n=1 Tax=Stratiformator vulcanicus TaxID=2527980 RepID=A0A517R412_9PLAN|nr:NAD-dependent epimerase/dehydratase family protein [Stratiformator vulcanicus]QDT38629.1 3 beta-hydroxysteroid dehydrogenase/Delta 5-->4-isomerase [Stratiformator vulcanicus]